MTGTSGRTSPRPFAYFDRAGSCWRTSEDTSASDSTLFSRTWPKRGSMRSGVSYEHRTWEPPTSGRASSLLPPDGASTDSTPSLHDQTTLLPTPTASQPGGTAEQHLARKNRMPDGARRTSVTDLRMALSLLPTPRTSDTNGPGSHGDGGPDLRTAVTLLPTPTVSDMKGPSPNHGGTTSEAIRDLKLLPTPRAQNGEVRNSKAWPRPLDEPQNLENALARVPTVERLLGASTSPPSDDGNDSSDDPPPTPPTSEDG